MNLNNARGMLRNEREIVDEKNPTLVVKERNRTSFDVVRYRGSDSVDDQNGNKVGGHW